eukprot:362377-Chlamydomonas_euryale.AAC.3
MEQSRRFVLSATRPLTDKEQDAFAALVHDRMTEDRYLSPVKTFKCVRPTWQQQQRCPCVCMDGRLTA